MLGQVYTFKHQYTADTGLLWKDTCPAGGGLPQEAVTHGCGGALDLPDTLGGKIGLRGVGYVNNVGYDAWGRPQQETLNASTNESHLTYQHDPHTGRLTDQQVTRTVASGAANHSMVGDSLGAAGAYWTTWAFDVLGNRTGQTRHGLAGGVADTSTSWPPNRPAMLWRFGGGVGLGAGPAEPAGGDRRGVRAGTDRGPA